ncbi:DUF1611 domain-containing protein [Halomicronema sp. CCY15110]|uniref:DUF1611 domain-containing protein n=1 Tax=Halomicronema sp. CCY15110 TaxID=2767773 RepID=UPI0019514D31|nr:DUF1611 domain-containing protein [Halomicronema sp. CCY15110]
MNYLTADQRIALLMHEGTDNPGGKTGLSILRYSPLNIVAVVDEQQAGKDLKAVTGIDRDVPIVESVQAALALQPSVLMIGIAPSGGALPEPWYEEVKAAVKAGLNVVNGLHTPMATDPQLTPHVQSSQWIWDVRQEPQGLGIASAAAKSLSCRRVLPVGTDMAIGKMSTNLELHKLAQQRGIRSKVIATGQTNMMLGDDGIPLDTIRVDFAAGAVEQQVMKYGPDHDILFIEGQGSIFHPGSTATLPLMRGSQPTHLILVHRLGQTHIRNHPTIPTPSLSEAIRIYEVIAAAGNCFTPAKTVGIALNTYGFDETLAKDAIAAATQETGLLATDVIRFGAEPLLDAILNN